jgi:salicylate hydroxylase
MSPSRESSPKIAIIGAGIGGLALAIGLVREGVPFTLYEAAGEYSTVGAGVGLGPNALRAMDLIDKRFRTMYNSVSSGNLTPGKEHIMMDAVYAEKGFGADRGWTPKGFGAACYDRTSAHRKDLLTIMTSLIPVEHVQFNKRVETFEQLGGPEDPEKGVRITFEDGEVVDADAVIGCDGVKGATRGWVLGSNHPDKIHAKYSGKYVYRSIIPMKDALEILGPCAGDAMTFMGPKVNFITFPISMGAECNLVAFKFDDTPWTHPQWTKRVSKETMLGDFGEGVDRRILKLLDVRTTPYQWNFVC